MAPSPLGEKMTKSEQIRRLYKHGIFTTAEIAVRVGCRPEYVRVVARQRVNGPSKGDRRYVASDAGVQAKETARQNRRNRVRAEYHALPPDVRKKVYRQTYRRARLSGVPPTIATNKAANAVAKRAREYAREASHA